MRFIFAIHAHSNWSTQLDPRDAVGLDIQSHLLIYGKAESEDSWLFDLALF
jgi:hypothetical protein